MSSTWQRAARPFLLHDVSRADVERGVAMASTHRRTLLRNGVPLPRTRDAAILADALRPGMKALIVPYGQALVTTLFDRVADDSSALFDTERQLRADVVSELEHMPSPRHRIASVWSRFAAEVDLVGAETEAALTKGPRPNWFERLDGEAVTYLRLLAYLNDGRPNAERLNGSVTRFVAGQFKSGVEVGQFVVEAAPRLLARAGLGAEVDDLMEIVRTSPLTTEQARLSGQLATSYQKLLSGCDSNCYVGHLAVEAALFDDPRGEQHIRDLSPHRDRIDWYDTFKDFIQDHGRYWYDLSRVDLFGALGEKSKRTLTLAPSAELWKLSDPETGKPVLDTIPFLERGCPMSVGRYIADVEDLLLMACANDVVGQFALDVAQRRELGSVHVPLKPPRPRAEMPSVQVPALWRTNGIDDAYAIPLTLPVAN